MAQSRPEGAPTTLLQGAAVDIGVVWMSADPREGVYAQSWDTLLAFRGEGIRRKVRLTNNVRGGHVYLVGPAIGGSAVGVASSSPMDLLNPRGRPMRWFAYLCNLQTGRARRIGETTPSGGRYDPRRRSLLCVSPVDLSRGEVALRILPVGAGRARTISWVSFLDDNTRNAPELSPNAEMVAITQVGGGAVPQPVLATIRLRDGRLAVLTASDGRPVVGRSPRWLTDSELLYVAPVPGSPQEASLGGGKARFPQEGVWSFDVPTRTAQPLWPVADEPTQ